MLLTCKVILTPKRFCVILNATLGRGDCMGVYFNPNNESYTQAKNSLIYVDKTELINELNKRLSTEYYGFTEEEI